MADIFISYRAARKEATEYLADFLKMHGYTVWYDFELITGDDFGIRIDEQLDSARIVLVLWCSLSIESEWVRAEAMRAKGNQTYFGVLAENIRLPTPFNIADTCDLTDWDLSFDSDPVANLITEIEKRIPEKAAIVGRTTLNKFKKDWSRMRYRSLIDFPTIDSNDRKLVGLDAKLEEEATKRTTLLAQIAANNAELEAAKKEQEAELKRIQKEIAEAKRKEEAAKLAAAKEEKAEYKRQAMAAKRAAVELIALRTKAAAQIEEESVKARIYKATSAESIRLIVEKYEQTQKEKIEKQKAKIEALEIAKIEKARIEQDESKTIKEPSTNKTFFEADTKKTNEKSDDESALGIGNQIQEFPNTDQFEDDDDDSFMTFNARGEGLSGSGSAKRILKKNSLIIFLLIGLITWFIYQRFKPKEPINNQNSTGENQIPGLKQGDGSSPQQVNSVKLPESQNNSDSNVVDKIIGDWSTNCSKYRFTMKKQSNNIYQFSLSNSKPNLYQMTENANGKLIFDVSNAVDSQRQKATFELDKASGEYQKFILNDLENASEVVFVRCE